MLPAFSFPQKEFERSLDDLVAMVVREYAAGLVAALLPRCLEQVTTASSGLVEYVASWLADPSADLPAGGPGVPASVGWDYAFGDAYRTLHNTGGDPVSVTAAIALHLGARGHAGSWTLESPADVRPRWDEWLLPSSRRLDVTASGQHARVGYSGAAASGTVALSAVEGRWRADGGRRLARVDRHGVSFTLLTRDALSMREYEDLVDRAVIDIDPRMPGVFDEAVDIIATFTPEYLPWISRAVHQVFLITPRPGRVESGSVEHYLGLVHLTEHAEPLPVAELLVHEATHQHMNVAAKLMPLDDGSDTRTYWSPPVETHRPLSKIVAAFHAFGNVILFYRWCRERGLGNRAECERQEALLGGWMADLAPPVRDNPALTPVGRGLCDPLLRELGYA